MLKDFVSLACMSLPQESAQSLPGSSQDEKKTGLDTRLPPIRIPQAVLRPAFTNTSDFPKPLEPPVKLPNRRNPAPAVNHLLNPSWCNDHKNTTDTVHLLEKTADFPDLVTACPPTLTRSRLFDHASGNTSCSPAQNRGFSHGGDPLQLGGQNNKVRYSTYGPTGRTEPPNKRLKVASRPVPMSPRTVTSGPSSMILQPQYQTVTIETENGTAQLAVDVQTASKAADEKHKQNATASDRYRQRRKEKERENSETISRLEVEASERAKERDYYMRERNYYRDLVYQNRICSTPRPPSPWRRRSPTPPFERVGADNL